MQQRSREREQFEGIEVPESADIVTASGSRFTSGFVDEFRRWDPFLHETLRKEDNERADYPTRDLQEFYKLFTDPKTPAFNKKLALNLFEIAREFEKTMMKLPNGRRLYDEQFAKLIWVALSLTKGAKSPRNMHIDGESGTGKTTVLSFIGEGLIRMQIRDEMRGAIIYVLQKGAHMNQQIFGADMRRRRVMREHPFEVSIGDIHKNMRFIAQTIGADLAGQLFPYDVCAALFAEKFHTSADAEKGVLATLEERGLSATFKKKVKDADNILRTLSLLFSNHNIILKGPGGRFSDFPVSEQKLEEIDEEHGFLTGDFARGIPKEYLERRMIYAPRDLGMNYLANENDEVPSAENADEGRSAIGLFSRGQLANGNVSETHWPLLRRTRAMLIDEGEDIPSGQWERYIQDLCKAHHTSIKDMFIVANRAPRYNDTIVPHWDVHSPKAPLRQLINDGILAPIGMDFFPGLKERRYDAGSKEANMQIIKHHFTRLPLYDQLNQAQPFEGDGVFVLQKDNIDEFVEMMEMEIDKRGSNARVLSYLYNNDVRAAADVQGLILAKRDYPLWIVTTPPPISKALSWPTMIFMTISLRNITKRRMAELASRLQHSHFHRIDKNYRTLFGEHSVTTTSYSDTIFHALNGGKEQIVGKTISNIAGSTYLSVEKRMKDLRIIKKDPERFPPVEIPAHNRYADMISVGKSTISKAAPAKPAAPTKEVVRSVRVAQPRVINEDESEKPIAPVKLPEPDEDATLDEILSGNFSNDDKVGAMAREMEKNLAGLPPKVQHNWTTWKPQLMQRARQFMEKGAERAWNEMNNMANQQW